MRKKDNQRIFEQLIVQRRERREKMEKMDHESFEFKVFDSKRQSMKIISDAFVNDVFKMTKSV